MKSYVELLTKGDIKPPKRKSFPETKFLFGGQIKAEFSTGLIK